MDREEASLFFRLVTYRYGCGSILITINKSVCDWTELLAGDEVLTAAILDRLLHNARVININGRSSRFVTSTTPWGSVAKPGNAGPARCQRPVAAQQNAVCSPSYPGRCVKLDVALPRESRCRLTPFGHDPRPGGCD